MRIIGLALTLSFFGFSTAFAGDCYFTQACYGTPAMTGVEEGFCHDAGGISFYSDQYSQCWENLQ